MPEAVEAAITRDKCAILSAMMLAAAYLPLPGVMELTVTQTGRSAVVRANRPFPKGTLLLLPLVPGTAQIAAGSAHPHAVRVTVGQRDLHLLPWWRPAWQTPFWAVRRCSDPEGCSAALAVLSASVVHSFYAGDELPLPGARQVLTGDVPVPVLVNTRDLEAGSEVVLLCAAAAGSGAQAPARKRARPSKSGG